MKIKQLIPAILFFSLLVSCNHVNKEKDLQTLDLAMADNKQALPQKANQKEQQKIPIGNLQTGTMDSAAAPALTKLNSNPDWDKKIIKTAHLKIEVKDFKNYNDNLHKIVKQFGGYIAQEEQNSSDEKTETAIVIKVPVNQFEDMMNDLPGNDGKVFERKISTEDVTADIVDTRSRLEAKKGMRLKYLEFLKQSKNMEEVLQVQNEINGIQEEMESAAGRVDFLSHQSSYSTINLNFFQPVNGYKPADANPSFFTRVNIAFKSGVAWIADLLVGIISIWPLFLLIVIVFMGYKKLKPAKILAQNP